MTNEQYPHVWPPKGGWIASLSNGDTVYETEPIKGERTPWQKLLQRCRTETHTVKGMASMGVTVPLKITAMRLQYGPITLNTMPQQMCNGYFQAREIHKIMYRDIDMLLHGVGSVVGDQVFINWIEFPPNGQVYIKSDVRPLASCKVHTTMN